MRKLILFLLCITSFFVGFAVNKPQAPKMKLGFIPNKGQSPKGVLYSYSGKQLNVQLRSNGFSYSVYERNRSNPLVLNQEAEENNQLISSRIDIDLVGSNSSIDYLASELGEGELIYHSPNNIEETYTVNHYRRVLYQNVYHNIDLEFLVEAETQNFKYNFILHPGANSQLIRLKINGAEGTQITKDGALQMQLGGGLLEERIPLSYEQLNNGKKGKEIEVSYKKIGLNLFGLAIGNHAKNKTIVVDPIVWSTYYGGSSTEYMQGCVTDTYGNIYVLGQTLSPDGISTPLAQKINLSVGVNTYDVFLAKFDSTGVLIWGTYFGGTEEEVAKDITMDNIGNIVITGYTKSASGIATSFGLQPAFGGATDGFITKYNNNGGLLWSTYFGFNGIDQMFGVCVDNSNDVYVCGTFNSVVNLAPGTYQMSNGGNYDGYIAKVSSDGLIVKAETFYGGALSDYITSICVDQAKNVYVAGYTGSSNGISTANGYKPLFSGSLDAFYSKFDSALTILNFGSYFGGTNADYIFDLTLDSENKMVMTGFTASTTTIATSGAFQTTYGGSSTDGFLMRTDNSGTPLWSTYFGGNSNDYLYSVCTGPNADIYIFGATTTNTGMSTSDAFQLTYGGGGSDALVAKFSKDGSRYWSSYLGGNGNDIGKEIFINNQGYLFFLGETYSSSGIATTGAHQVILKGTNDVFIVKFLQNISQTSISNNTISPNQGLCLGNVAQTLVGTTPTGGDGNFNYHWLSSLSGLAGSFTPASGANSNDTYLPGALSVNMYYKRVVLSGTYTDTSNMISVIVSTNLSAGFVVNKTIQCVKTNQFIFSDTTTSSAGTLSYYWDFGNGKTSLNQTDTVVYDFAVNNGYQVKLVTSLNGGCADTSVLNVFTIANPMTKTINGKDTVLKGTTEVYNVTGTVGSNYNWIFSNGNGRSYTNTLNIKWTQVGDVQLKMVETNSGSCLGDTAIKNIYVKQPTSEEELFGLDLKIYPNPSEGLFYLETSKTEKILVTIYDLTGKLIYTNEQYSNAGINLFNHDNGFYLMHLSDSQGNTVRRKIQLFK